MGTPFTAFGSFPAVCNCSKYSLRDFAESIQILARQLDALVKGAAIVKRLARGLYQRPDATVDANHTLAEASKLVPKGVICLASALAFHELTDQLLPKVWMAIGSKDWRPQFHYPPVRFARFPETQLSRDVEHHRIDGVRVPIFEIAKSITDLFCYRRTVGINLALEGLREALRKRKTTPAAIAKCAVEAGVWKTIEPYLIALTSNA